MADDDHNTPTPVIDPEVIILSMDEPALLQDQPVASANDDPDHESTPADNPITDEVDCDLETAEEEKKTAREIRNEKYAKEVDIQEDWVKKKYNTLINVLVEEMSNVEIPKTESVSEKPLEGGTAEKSEEDTEIETKPKEPFSKRFKRFCCQPNEFSCCGPLLRRFACYRTGWFREIVIPESDTIEKAQKLGWKQIKNGLGNIYTDTPIGSTVRECASYIGLLLTLGFFLSSAANLITDQTKDSDTDDDNFLIFSVVFGSLGLIFTIFDVSYQGYHRRCKTCKGWIKWYKKRKMARKINDPEASVASEQDETENTQVTTEDNLDIQSIEQQKEGGEELEEHGQVLDPGKCCEEKCTCCAKKYSAAVDVARLVFTEMLYYPAMILSIFQFINRYTVEGNPANSAFSWLQLIFSFGSSLFSVYAIRVFILAGSVYSMASLRSVKLKGMTFQLSFVGYAYGTMALQILMIISISACYYSQYYTYYFYNYDISSGNGQENRLANSEDFKLGLRLWYMIIVAYITPIISVVMFFLVHYFWTAVFPIEFVFDFVRVLKSTSLTGVKGAMDENEKTLEEASIRLNEGELDKDYDKIIKTSFKAKFTYPFKNPPRIILSFLYIYMLYYFFLTAFTFPQMSSLVTPLDPIVWSFFFIGCFIFAMILNIYAYTIALVWSWILAGIAFIFCLVICASCTPQRQRQRYR